MAKPNSVIVVDIAGELALLNVDLHPKLKITASKIISLPKDKRDKVVLESLSNFIRENSILHKNAILKPSLDSLFIKRLRLPNIPEAELSEAVKWQVKEELSFDLSKGIIDFLVLDQRSLEDGSKMLDIICAAAGEDEVGAQVSLLKQAGLNCLAVIPLPFAYAKLLGRHFFKQKEECAGILHIEEERCFFSMHKGSNLEFFRDLPFSISKLRDSLRGVLISDKGRTALSNDQAQEALFKTGLLEAGGQIFSMLRPDLERLASEIKRSLDYYTSQFKREAAVNNILLSGRAIDIPDIDKFLKTELSLNVGKISVLNLGSQIPQALYEGLSLAIDYGQGINLLPYEFRVEKFERLQKVSLRWIGFIAGALLFFSYLFASVGINAYKRRLENARLHLNVLSEVKAAKDRIEEFNKFIAQVSASQPDAGSLLKKLSNIAPRDLFIEALSINSELTSFKASGYIKSISQSPDVILNRFVSDMQSTQYFSDVSISSLEKTADMVKFNLTSKLK